MHQLTTWLNRMVKTWMATLFVLSCCELQSQQTLDLSQAFELAEKNYPASRQKALIRESDQLNQKNLQSANFPQVSVNGLASYQSEVTRVEIPISGVKVPEQEKDQYKLYAELSQQLYDGGLTRHQKHVQQLSTKAEEAKIDVELYQLKSKVNQLYFAIVYHQQLLRQSELLKKDVEIGIAKVKPQVENGTVLRSNLLVLEAQKLQVEQRSIEIRSSYIGLINALASLIGISIDEYTKFDTPKVEAGIGASLSRQELNLYNRQSELLQAQKLLVNARIKPKLSAFAQGGYGRPALNMFSTQFDPYYIAGLRMNWSISALYNAKRDKQLIEINKQSVDIQKETFVLNTKTQLVQQRSDIHKYEKLVVADQAIVELRKKISEAATAQLENAVITANDYLREISAEDQAKQNLILHQTLLLQSKAVYAITNGTL